APGGAAAAAPAGSATPDIRLVELVKRYGDVTAVDGVTQEMPGGEFFTLLGPSGCGKTTTLRLIAGFEKLDSGAIKLDGVDISDKPPHKRPVNTVFQSYALFPHMTVAENVAFGLRYQRCTKAEAARRVSDAMDMVQLSALANRRPAQLSGGQQQRVALARAIVLEPPVLLLDEPLGALDARLRVDLQVELKRIQETLGITFVYVTHDQDEALTMSDRVAVMRGGKVQQCDEPRVLYEEPTTAFVANFLGASNLIPVEVSGGGLKVGEFQLRAELDGQSGEALAMIRPERVRLEPHGTSGENRVPGMVESVVYLGFHQDVRVRLASGALIRCDVPNDGTAPEYESGDPVAAHLPADCLRVLESDS
ncbi:MAG TPA: ABC transporter ATP-binding protein, partial [Solirubrobacter sp.]|nr:ABC transporter ATP-binding protein [Solirubrobacter sp.]